MKFKKLPSKIRIFDFDDTLATTDAKIRILNKGLALSTDEFAKYHVEPDDKVDFSDFEKGLINPKPTNFLKSAFRNIISGDADIMILTARANTSGIREFLSHWVNPERLIIVGGGVGVTGKEATELKKKAILNRLDDYEDVKFFDDSDANIEAIKSIGSPKIKVQKVIVKR